MTVLLPLGRNASLLASRSQVLTRFAIPTSLLRVTYFNNDKPGTSVCAQQARIYRLFSTTITRHATDSGTKPVGRPKAHTGKAPAKKKTGTSASTSTKRAAAGSKGGRKKTAKKSKAKAKPKAKPKATRRSGKKVPSATTLRKRTVAQRKENQQKALLNAPKKLPENAWLVYFVENKAKGISFAQSGQETKEIGAKYHTLSPEERERLNHIANENKTKNAAAYKTWISQYTPLQIKEANNARKQIATTKGVTRTGKKREVHRIKDVRLVKRPRNAYSLFLGDRYKSGDFRGMLVKECGPLISREWKALSASEKKPFQDQAQADLHRYKEEYKTVYGVDVPKTTKAASAA